MSGGLVLRNRSVLTAPASDRTRAAFQVFDLSRVNPYGAWRTLENLSTSALKEGTNFRIVAICRGAARPDSHCAASSKPSHLFELRLLLGVRRITRSTPSDTRARLRRRGPSYR